jgi:hypothetical protein
LKDEALSVVIGTEQLAALTIDARFPLQSVESTANVTPSLYLMFMM